MFLYNKTNVRQYHNIHSVFGDFVLNFYEKDWPFWLVGGLKLEVPLYIHLYIVFLYIQQKLNL